jgi:polyphosphate:AMP phosphotransferase
MFEAAEIDHAVSKTAYEKQVARLRTRLLEEQYELLERKSRALVVLVNGVDGAGKGNTVNTLNGWLDARHMPTFGFGKPSEEERERPALWRFWQVLPPRGKIGVFVGSWYSNPILSRAYDESDDATLDQALGRIRHFEAMLYEDDVVLLKLWFHISKQVQAQRFRELRADALTRWRVTKRDLRHHKLYDDFHEVASRVLRETSTDTSPWMVIPGREPRYRHLAVGRTLLDTLSRLNRRSPRKPPPIERPTTPTVDDKNVLSAVDLKKTLGRADYNKKLERLQGRLFRLCNHARFQGRSLIVVFEGWDAAGKGGAIRRVTAALDARMYKVVQIAAPSEEELAYPYLWRFWRRVPGRGKVVLFDRSYYGRVLVERVEGYASTEDWNRAYLEINEFEEQLVDNGGVIVKLWLHIDPREQLARFRARKSTGFKHYKITKDDYRNRRKWPEYESAVTDMIDRTSSELAPWTLVPAVDKRYARIHVLETIVRTLAGALSDKPRRRLKRHR